MARNKRLLAARSRVEKAKFYPLLEAIKLIKENATAKFDETVEVAINLGVDPRRSDQMVRGMLSLPHGTGKSVRVGVFARGVKAQEAQEAGADVVGADDLAERVQAGNIGFDRCIATPDMMVLVGKLGKILGPRGLMPNPKLGTVTMDVANAVKVAKSGQIEYRADRSGIVHTSVGKASFDEASLKDNIRTLMDVVQKSRPTGAKGTYMQRMTVSSTMGPGIRVDIASALEN